MLTGLALIYLMMCAACAPYDEFPRRSTVYKVAWVVGALVAPGVALFAAARLVACGAMHLIHSAMSRGK